MTKLLPVLAAVYVLSPLDLLPHIIPVVGRMDDMIVAGGLLLLFFVLAPREVVLEHLLGTGSREEPAEQNDRTVDGSFRYTDEEKPR